jgi:Xaa-Pro aminopeptidase
MNQTKIFAQRINKLQKNIPTNTLLLLSNQRQIAYFSGFNFLVNSEREAFFVCSKTSAFLIYTSFSPTDNHEFITYLPGSYPSELRGNIENIVTKTKATNLLFDSNTLFVAEHAALQQISSLNVTAFTKNPAFELMIIKDTSEIEKISHACKISNQVLQNTISNLQVGMTEIEVADYIYQNFEQAGIKKLAFPTIVAFGQNSAKPHHQPTETKLEEDMAVLIDMGGKYLGYCSDMTRTIWFGSNPDTHFLEIETIIKNAYSNALSAIKTDITAKQVDAAARVYISNQGYGDNFIHTTGHGLGLEIHEQPSISWQNSMKLVPNQTITIEPGIYLEGNFGYRHENTILTTKDGVKVLTEL